MINLSTIKWPALVLTAFIAGVVGTAVIVKHHPEGVSDTHGTQESGKSDLQPDGDAQPKPDADSGDKDKSDADGNGDSAKSLQLSPMAIKNGGIVVGTVAYSTSSSALIAPGTVQTRPEEVAAVTPPAAGKITRILVHLGQDVRAGQPLVTLNSFDISQAQNAVDQAQTSANHARALSDSANVHVLQARGTLNSAELVLHRQMMLAKTGVYADAPLQAAEISQNEAHAALLAADAELQSQSKIYRRDKRLLAAGVVSQAEYDQAQADMTQSQISKEQAASRDSLMQSTYLREKSIRAEGLLNLQALQPAQAEVQADRTEVQSAVAELQAARDSQVGANSAVTAAKENLAALAGGEVTPNQPGQLTLTAPLGGTISAISATLGKDVERSNSLVVINNLHSVSVIANIAEQSIARVRNGLPVDVTVSSFPGRHFSGRVESIATGLDEKTRTLEVRCIVDNSAGLLRPDMFAQVALFTDGRSIEVTVPTSALVSDSGKENVFVATRHGFDQRTVAAGRTIGERTQILQGVLPGEHIVTQGALVLLSESKKGDLKDTD